MIDLLKSTLFTGIGLGIMSKEKVEYWAKDFVKKNSIAEDEGKKFINDLLDKSDMARKSLEEKIAKISEQITEKYFLNQKKEIVEIKNKIAQLEKRIQEIESK